MAKLVQSPPAGVRWLFFRLKPGQSISPTRLKAAWSDATETDACAYLSAMLTGPNAQLRALAEPVAKPPEIPPGAPIGAAR